MISRVNVIEQLQSFQVAKFYTGIKSVAYTYQALIIYMNLLLLYSYGVFDINSLKNGGIKTYKGKQINLSLFQPIAFAMILDLLVLYPILMALQIQIFKAIINLKTECEIGTNFIQNLGVRIKDVSTFTGSVDLSHVEKV